MTNFEEENVEKVKFIISELPYFYDDCGSTPEVFVHKMNEKNALLSLEDYVEKATSLKNLVYECNVVSLKSQLKSVLAEYTKYSLTHCRLSIFHRHGETGRVRATQFTAQLCKESDEAVIRTKILQYLKDAKNVRSFFPDNVVQKFTHTEKCHGVYFDIYLKSLTNVWCSLKNQPLM